MRIYSYHLLRWSLISLSVAITLVLYLLSVGKKGNLKPNQRDKASTNKLGLHQLVNLCQKAMVFSSYDWSIALKCSVK